MGKLMDFLMETEVAGPVTSQVDIAGFPHPFAVTSITEAENKVIRKSCQKVSFDKKTHQKSTDIDTDLYSNCLVVACCVEPNFKDAQLQARYGVMGAEELVDVLLKPGQFIELLTVVQEINGYSNDVNDLRDEAKN